MFDTIFSGLFDSGSTTLISVSDFLLCIGVSLGIGLLLAFAHMFRNRYTKSFALTLSLLPAVVCVVIMMVNGNVGAGVAVAGAFSLVRFRSVPGNAREITMLFLAMGAGLVAGMGYLGFAVLFALLMGGITVLYHNLDFGVQKNAEKYKTLTITIPEDLNYSQAFTDIFHTYTTSCQLVRVKTTNMGSMYRLTYCITLRGEEKEMIDALRCRNGNLEISLSQQESAPTEL